MQQAMTPIARLTESIQQRFQGARELSSIELKLAYFDIFDALENLPNIEDAPEKQTLETYLILIRQKVNEIQVRKFLEPRPIPQHQNPSKSKALSKEESSLIVALLLMLVLAVDIIYFAKNTWNAQVTTIHQAIYMFIYSTFMSSFFGLIYLGFTHRKAVFKMIVY